MAYISNYTGKDGRRGFRFFARKAPNAPKQSMTWFPKETWSDNKVKREKMRAYSEFEHAVRSGIIISKKEAKEAEDRRAAELTFREFTETVFLPEIQPDVSAHTLASYTADLKNHIYPKIGNQKITEITTSLLNELFKNLKETCDSHGQKLKVATRQKTHQHLNKIFAAALDNHILKENPMKDVKRPKKTDAERNTQDEEKAYSEQESGRILQCLSEEVTQARASLTAALAGGKPGVKERQDLLTAMKWQVYCMILLYTGCRRGETVGILTDEVDYSTGVIQIQRSVNYAPKEGIYFGLPKNRETRDVAVPMHVVTLLVEYLDTLNEQRSACGIQQPCQEKNFIFTQDDLLTVMHPDSPTRFFSKFGERHAIVKFHPHKLRHTFATISIEHGAPIADVSSVLGHASPEITLRIYTHADPKRKFKVTGIFDQALSSSATDSPQP